MGQLDRHEKCIHKELRSQIKDKRRYNSKLFNETFPIQDCGQLFLNTRNTNAQIWS